MIALAFCLSTSFESLNFALARVVSCIAISSFSHALWGVRGLRRLVGSVDAYSEGAFINDRQQQHQIGKVWAMCSWFLLKFRLLMLLIVISCES
jgi:hypothetical protein